MGTERINVYAKVGKSVLAFSGAKWFYGDADIRSKTGIKRLKEDTLDDGDVVIEGVQAKRYLARLTATLAADTVLTNGAQSEKRRQFQFYCDPEFVEEAMTKLPGKSLDEGLLPGSWKIVKVQRKLEISRA